MTVYKYKWSGKHDGRIESVIKVNDTNTYLSDKKFWEDNSGPDGYYQDVKLELLESYEVKPIDRIGANSYYITNSALVFDYEYGSVAFRKGELTELITDLQKIHDSLVDTEELEIGAKHQKGCEAT